MIKGMVSVLGPDDWEDRKRGKRKNREKKGEKSLCIAQN
jgi:hypothetical protein